MIVQKVKHLKDSTYEVVIEDKSYSLDEETILKHRLLEGHELTSKELEECLKENELELLKHKAYTYGLRYQKNSYEILRYLTEKEVPYALAKRVVDTLKETKLLEDKKLASFIAASLARNSNGIYMIQYKLKNRHFQEEDIQYAIQGLALEDIEEGRTKLLAKGNKKYAHLEEREKKHKLKNLFYQHGYQD